MGAKCVSITPEKGQAMYERNLTQWLLRGAVALMASACAFGVDPSARAGDTIRYAFCNATSCADGASSSAVLFKTATKLYGTTLAGGQYGSGTVFSVNPNGTGYTVLHSFGSITNDGASAVSGVVKIGNRLYGAADTGGQYGEGILYSVKTNGTGYTVLHTFDSNANDGAFPYGGLLDVGGTLYGTTFGGGASTPFCSGCGTVFEIQPSGAGYQVLYSFCSLANCTDGSNPFAPVLNVNGTLYGTTGNGGTSGLGTVFSLVPCGSPPCAEQALYSFAGSPDGQAPLAGLVYKPVGNVGYLYGTTSGGGAGLDGTVFAVAVCGTPPCAETWRYSFVGGPNDGWSPDGGLLAWGSYLYGATTIGGTSNQGVVFKIRANELSGETLVWSFAGSPDGAVPEAGLIRIGNALYGTTANGGTNNAICGPNGCGTIFSIP